MLTERTNRFPRLLADVGGTNARFGLEIAPMQVEKVTVMSTRDHATIEAAIASYLESIGLTTQEAVHAVIGIANPVLGDLVKMTNHSWAFSISEARRHLGLELLLVLNDFAALAHALPYLPIEGLQQLGGGQADIHAPRVLLGAGTGLGVSTLVPCTNGDVAVAGEGGHISFSPFNDEEIRLWQFARKRFGHVSAERMLCGAGIKLIYEALCEQDAVSTSIINSAAEITERAFKHGDKRCQKTVDIFCAMLGTVAADLALISGARGGVYIGGGIVPKLGEAFFQSSFRQRFEDKGRFSHYLSGVPVFVIKAPIPAFTGLSVALSAHLGGEILPCGLPHAI